MLHSPTPNSGGVLPPVIIVHGYRGNPFQPGGPFLCPADIEQAKAFRLPDMQGKDFYNIDCELSNLGYSVYFAQLHTSPCYTPPYAENVEPIAATIEKAKQETRQSKVIIIAHSMGGLAARAYIEESQYHSRNDVAELFTLSTPFYGVNISDQWFTILFAPASMSTFDFLRNQHVTDNFSQGPKFPPNGSRNPDVVYHLLGSHYNGARTVLGRATEFLGGSVPNDGLVPLQSALSLPDVADKVPYTTSPGIAHGSEFGLPDFFIPNGTSAAHNYIISTLRRRVEAARGTPTLSPTRAFSPPQPSANTLPTPRPRCEKREFVTLMKQYGIGIHLGDALAQYHTDCAFQPTELAEEAASQGLSISLASVKSSEASMLVMSGTLRTGIPDPGATPIADIPGSRVLTLDGDTYIFYPVSATTRITLTNVPTTTLKLFRATGTDGGMGYTYPTEHGKVFELPAGQTPNLQVIETPGQPPSRSISPQATRFVPRRLDDK